MPWSLDGQRGYIKARACLEGGAGPDELQPGVMVEGEDIGHWLQHHEERWSELTTAQQERLGGKLGVRPAPKPHKAAQGRRKAGAGAREGRRRSEGGRIRPRHRRATAIPRTYGSGETAPGPHRDVR